MSNDLCNKYGRYLSSLMGSVLNSTAPKAPFEGINWDTLYQLAAHHNVLTLIYPAISQFTIPEDIKSEFIHHNNLIIARETRQEIEAQRIFKLLSDAGIRFIKLKGIFIKNLYPAPYMRSSADVDICMTKEDREQARSIMQQAGYTLKTSIDYADEYNKDNFYLYELHSAIVTKKAPYAQLFSDPFSKSVKDSHENSYVLCPEYFYLHLVLHLLNHFLTGGCGLRQLCDLYVFEKTHPNLDLDFVSKALKAYELTRFFNTIRKLTFDLLEDKPLSQDEADIADFIFKSGEYGSVNLKHIAWLDDDKNVTWTFSKKCRYFLGLWFPGVRTLKKRYPVLEKAPILLPICWVRRIFYTIFFKRSAIKGQQREIKRLNSQELKEAKRIRKLSGLE